jgi:hypothetical protein
VSNIARFSQYFYKYCCIIIYRLNNLYTPYLFPFIYDCLLFSIQFTFSRILLFFFGWSIYTHVHIYVYMYIYPPFTHTCHGHLHVKFSLRHRSCTHCSFYSLYQFVNNEIILEELKSNNDREELFFH